MNDRRAASMLGIARRAGKVESGEYATEQAIRRGRAKLLILSVDASENTVKKFMNMAEGHHVPAVRFRTKAELGHAIGTGDRSCLAVTDDGLAGAVSKYLEEE
ncbi:MAG: L7Ae/L30e/S12e/Gadd45 family ribosomal protein [Bilifractor sp.]|jgi:ribosomal protein L7Ae-like RNA K-turn-binding protein